MYAARIIITTFVKLGSSCTPKWLRSNGNSSGHNLITCLAYADIMLVLEAQAAEAEENG